MRQLSEAVTPARPASPAAKPSSRGAGDVRSSFALPDLPASTSPAASRLGAAPGRAERPEHRKVASSSKEAPGQGAGTPSRGAASASARGTAPPRADAARPAAPADQPRPARPTTPERAEAAPRERPPATEAKSKDRRLEKPARERARPTDEADIPDATVASTPSEASADGQSAPGISGSTEDAGGTTTDPSAPPAGDEPTSGLEPDPDATAQPEASLLGPIVGAIAAPAPGSDASAATDPHPPSATPSIEVGAGAAKPTSRGTDRALEVIAAQGHSAPPGLAAADARKDGETAGKESRPGHAPMPDPNGPAEPETKDKHAPEASGRDIAATLKAAEPAGAEPSSTRGEAPPPLPSVTAAMPKGGAAPPAVPASHAGGQPALVAHAPLGAVPIEIGMKALAGLNRFEIRLDPEELGRIDVRLDIRDGGEVKAHLVVDRVETLALLQRDARSLERAFEQAGLRPSEGGVDLSLRDPGADARQQGGRPRDPEPAQPPRGGEARGTAPEAPISVATRYWRSGSGVDLTV